MNVVRGRGQAGGDARPDDVVHRALADLLRLTRTALDEATTALVGDEPVMSLTLMMVEKALREARARLEDHASAVEEQATGMAVRATSATPRAVAVRRIVAEVLVNSDIAGMAELVRQVADMAHSRTLGTRIPAPTRTILREMSEQCGQLVESAAALAAGEPAPPVAEPVAPVAPRGDRYEAGYAQVRARQRRLLLECGDECGDVHGDPHDGTELEAATVAALAGRCFERFAEHAVSVARQVRLLAGSHDPAD